MSILDRLLGTDSDDESCCNVEIEEVDDDSETTAE